MFGIGFAISIPLVALAFAVDNVGLLVQRTFSSLMNWTRNPSRRLVRRSQSQSPTEIEKTDIDGLRKRMRSRESHGRGSHESGVETDTDGELSPTRTIVRREKDEPEWKGRISTGVRDLERGINGVS